MLIDPRVQPLGYNRVANHHHRLHTQRLAQRRVTLAIMRGAQNKIRARGCVGCKTAGHIGKHGAAPLEKRFSRDGTATTRDHKRVCQRHT